MKSQLLALLAVSMLTAARSAPAEDAGSLARIQAVEGTNPLKVTLKVAKGALYNDTEVEILTPAGKVAAQMKLPPSIDMLLAGDEVKGITLQLRRAAAVENGLVAEPGKYPDYAAAQRMLGAGGAAPSPVPPPPAGPRTTAAACPYTAAELSAALGIQLDAGRGHEMAFAGGASLSCTYDGVAGLPSVIVNQIVMTPSTLAASRAEYEKRLAGRLEPVPSDPDGAKFQVGQGDLTGVTLHYLRRDRQVEVRVMGSKLRDAALVEQMRGKLVKLRRLP